MTIELNEARALLAQGDLGGSVRSLRPVAEQLPLPELVTFLIELADAAELEPLASSARAALPDATDARALTMLGYDCVEYGLSFAAVPVLHEALRVDSTVRQALAELVAALEDEHRHAEAVEVLGRYASNPREWAEHYLLVYNSILAGDPATARAEFADLPEPDDDWVFARDRVSRMLIRADRAAAVSTLDHRDLRGWQFTLTGGYLATMSPYGFDAGMTGRWAYLGDNAALCRYSIHRVALALSAAGRAPRTVSLLPDRADRIIGLATARVLDLPTQEYEPGTPDTLVVAYDLRTVDPDLIVTLHERAPGQILFEHATCWTQPPPVTADISGLLHQTVIAPWAPTQRVGENGLEPVPADDRPESEIAAEIAAADPTPDAGDGETPPDLDPAFTTFVATTADTWLLGPRTPVRSPGPVRSSFFG
ncbi:tetratricopeptide repeat protein [Nocardia sp. JW2]|uniref:tetratricopeptide repeat protein n=1 Tax=Nocardia sp. JW2 TaxID=3450738 RepID=UPI003F4417E3